MYSREYVVALKLCCIQALRQLTDERCDSGQTEFEDSIIDLINCGCSAQSA